MFPFYGFVLWLFLGFLVAQTVWICQWDLQYLFVFASQILIGWRQMLEVSKKAPPAPNNLTLLLSQICQLVFILPVSLYLNLIQQVPNIVYVIMTRYAIDTLDGFCLVNTKPFFCHFLFYPFSFLWERLLFMVNFEWWFLDKWPSNDSFIFVCTWIVLLRRRFQLTCSIMIFLWLQQALTLLNSTTTDWPFVMSIEAPFYLHLNIIHPSHEEAPFAMFYHWWRYVFTYYF